MVMSFIVLPVLRVETVLLILMMAYLLRRRQTGKTENSAYPTADQWAR